MPEERSVLVRLGEFKRGSVSRRLEVSADLEAVEHADVPAEISGVISEVLKREGDTVKAGEPVVLLDVTRFQLEVDTKTILAAQAKDKVRQADVARRDGEKQKKQKELLLGKARDAFERLNELSKDGSPEIVSEEQREEKRIEWEQAQIDHDASVLQEEKYRLEYDDATHNAKLADVDLKTAQYNLSQAKLESPIDGVIHYLDAKPGELVSTTGHVFSVTSIGRLEARLHVPQRELASLREGLVVEITTKVFPEEVFKGRVEVVNPVIQKDNGTVQVLVGIEDPAGLLKPGLYVSASIVLETHEDVLLVPKKAISYINKKPILFLVRDGVAHRYSLEPGFTNRDHIEVLGLRAMDGSAGSADDGALVLVGHNNLKEGTKVEEQAQ